MGASRPGSGYVCGRHCRCRSDPAARQCRIEITVSASDVCPCSASRDDHGLHGCPEADIEGNNSQESNGKEGVSEESFRTETDSEETDSEENDSEENRIAEGFSFECCGGEIGGREVRDETECDTGKG